MNSSLITLNCPNCGGALQCENTKMKIFCQHCGTQILVKDFITDRRIDKEDTKASLLMLIKNSISNNDYQRAFNYYEELCRIDPQQEHFVNMNIMGFLSGNLIFQASWLKDLYIFSTDEHRKYLQKLLQDVKALKQKESNNALKIADLTTRNNALTTINKKYTFILRQINAEIMAIATTKCICGHYLEYTEDFCKNCGRNRIQIKQENSISAKVKKFFEKFNNSTNK